MSRTSGVTITADFSEWRLFKHLASKSVRPAAASALTKAARKVWTLSRRKIAADLGIPIRPIARRGKVIRATQRALTARISAVNKPINLADLGATHAKGSTGVTARGYTVPGSFLAQKGGSDGPVRSTPLWGGPKGARNQVRAFKRRGKARRPLTAKVGVDIRESIDKTFRSVERNTVPKILGPLFRHEMEYRIRHKPKLARRKR
ncbi:MAG: hypothetical protein KC591_17500 [Gemmatimonadetes bacterium]|nr:hypothetical protein [Gemmatimonadota bacterium]